MGRLCTYAFRSNSRGRACDVCPRTASGFFRRVQILSNDVIPSMLMVYDDRVARTDFAEIKTRESHDQLFNHFEQWSQPAYFKNNSVDAKIMFVLCRRNDLGVALCSVYHKICVKKSWISELGRASHGFMKLIRDTVMTFVCMCMQIVWS